MSERTGEPIPRTSRAVAVWLAWRPEAVPPERLTPLAATLSPDEEERAARYRDPRDAAAFRWSRGVQRTILARHLGAAPESLRFLQRGDEKPALAPLNGRRCEYNVSHSGSLFALAVAEQPVGIDIECVRPVPRMDVIARRVFDATTANAITAAAPDHRSIRFFTAWTQLEAHAKLHGQGVWRILADRERHAAAEGVQVASFAAPEGYFGAIAIAGAAPRVELRWWEG